jgi:hypothetical protein
MTAASIWNKIPALQSAMEVCLADGMSAAETARALNRQFGCDLSRRAILGRKWRRATLPKDRPPRVKRVPKVVPLTEPKPTGADGPRCCKWLHGSPSARLFCGAVTKDLTSWCAYHDAKVRVSNATPYKHSQKTADWFAGRERTINQGVA